LIPDLPVEFNPQDAVQKNQFIFNYEEKGKASYGILPRGDKDAKRIKWFDVDTHSVFHFVNSWDSTNDLGHEIVTCVAVVHSTINIGLLTEHFDSPDMPNQIITKFEFNLTTGETSRKPLHSFKCEFPVINQEFVGRQNRYVYLAAIQETDAAAPQICKDNGFYNSVLKFDILDEKPVGLIEFGENLSGGEVFYQ
jgi:carotenoid cleavage dioxygenase-like enzyme